LPPEHPFFEEEPKPTQAAISPPQFNLGGASEWAPLRQEDKRSLKIQEIGSGAAPIAPIGSVAEVAGASQPFGVAAPAGAQEFWLWVKTELILYGATEPDARVTIDGLPVNLRDDGTFSVRFALPEGEQAYPVHAVNAASDHTIEITPIVRLRTEK
jgi:hypothetical protein